MNGSPPSGLFAARVITGSLAAGVIIMWGVALVLSAGRSGADPTLSGPEPRLVFWLWGAVALSSLAAAVYFRGRALAQVRRFRLRSGGADEAEGARRLNANLIIAWALLEGPALLGGALFIVYGTEAIAWLALPLYLVAMTAFFPRAEWYRTFERAAVEA